MSDKTDTDSEDMAYAKILRILSYHDQSRFDLLNKLKKAGFSEQVCISALDRAQSVDLVNDERFCETYIRQKYASGYGVAGIIKDLSLKEIESDVYEKYIVSITSDDDQVERAISYLDNHKTHSKRPKESAYRKLISKGYESSVASTASRIWYEANY